MPPFYHREAGYPFQGPLMGHWCNRRKLWNVPGLTLKTQDRNMQPQIQWQLYIFLLRSKREHTFRRRTLRVDNNLKTALCRCVRVCEDALVAKVTLHSFLSLLSLHIAPSFYTTVNKQPPNRVALCVVSRGNVFIPITLHLKQLHLCKWEIFGNFASMCSTSCQMWDAFWSSSRIKSNSLLGPEAQLPLYSMFYGTFGQVSSRWKGSNVHTVCLLKTGCSVFSLSRRQDSGQ